jgi:hypothetical protein
MIQLRPGLRLRSAACRSEVVVVRGSGEVDLRCGGVPMVPVDAGASGAAPPAPVADGGEGTLLGKRYAHQPSGVEVLCTKPGAGRLTVGPEPLELKAAKPLPSSD